MKTTPWRTVSIPLGKVDLDAYLHIPEGAKGLVIFSHGSGSSRHSPRNQFVGEELTKQGMAILLADLLTEDEDNTYETRFDIDLLTERLVGLTQWASEEPKLESLGVGYFGASTGAASALRSAAILKEKVQAVVSRGGRPDMALGALPMVESPTLLIVGSLDWTVLELNRRAYGALNCEKKLVILEGATHLFEEPGKLEEVAQLAAQWFEEHLTSRVELAR